MGYAHNERCLMAFIETTDAFEEDVAEGEVVVNGGIVSEGERAFLTSLGIPATSPESFARQLKSAGDEVVMRINTPGGDITAGSGMVQRMTEAYKAGRSIDAVIMGIAASLGYILAAHAQSVSIAELGSVYVHRPMRYMNGMYYSDELAEASQEVSDREPAIAAFVARRSVNYSELDADDIDGLMRGKTGGGTWLPAAKALSANMVDRINFATPGGSETENSVRDNTMMLRVQMHEWLRHKELGNDVQR